MEKTIYLVRHGETVANHDGKLQGWTNFSLSEEGEEQARQLVVRAEKIHIDRIYVSDLVRTRQTAAPLAAERGLKPIELPGLREISFGRWEGHRYSEMKQEDPELLRTLFQHPAAADVGAQEKLEDSQKRIWQAFQSIEQGMQDGETVLAVSHGGILRILLCCLLSMPLDAMWRLGLDNTAAIKVVCGGVVDYWVDYWNMTGPL